MNAMTKILNLYANYTILIKDNKYITKGDTMQRLALQFYWSLETSEE